MKYILVYMARRKNAKRHIQGRYATVEECLKRAWNPHYDFYIYDYKWNLVQKIEKEV